MNLTIPGVFERYEMLRPRLPSMPAVDRITRAPGLLEIADEFDAFLFDAFGVLVLGETPIEGTQATVAALKAMGKSTLILSNAATEDAAGQHRKYARLGYPFAAEEIVSSRSVLLASLGDLHEIRNWAAMLPAGNTLDGLPAGIETPHTHPERFWNADGYLFLSSRMWTQAMQARLEDRLAAHPVPVLIGNPDLVAPRETGLSLEPGFFAHALLDRLACDVRFFGKPFGNAFDMALGRIELTRGPIDRSRVAMVGDTLHTDILGAASAGLRTVLVTDHGVLKGQDVEALIGASGIRPDFIVPSI